MNFHLKSSIKHIMTKELYLLNVQDPIALVKKIFDGHEFRHLPVVSHNEVVGMVGEDDLHLLEVMVKHAMPSELKLDLRVEEFMHKNPDCIHEDEPICEVAERFSEGQPRAIPVIDHDGIVGIVTTTDIIKFLMEYSTCSNEKEKNNPSKEQLR